MGSVHFYEKWKRGDRGGWHCIRGYDIGDADDWCLDGSREWVVGRAGGGADFVLVVSLGGFRSGWVGFWGALV